MMISGYEIGTQVKWNENGGITTGRIEKVFHRPRLIDLNGIRVRVSVTNDSPTYLIQRDTPAPDAPNDVHVVLPHQRVFLEDANAHM